ncbi:MAG: ATP-dependent Clp protease proteolytic subunit, partial [Oscillospiraceae bacterium]
MGISDMIQIELPFGRENQKLPDPDLLFLYEDMKDRHFWLDQEINLDSCSLFLKYIQYLNRNEKHDMTPITVHIASPGGELSTMFAVYHALRKSEIPIHTINEAGAHSAAFIIFLAGDIRSMNPDATFIAHEG